MHGEVEIPAGEQSADVFILAADDSHAEGTETVVLTLLPTLCLIEPCPVISWPGQATVSILDNDTGSNAPPTVTLHFPQEGEVFAAPADILLRAAASDQEDGHEISVEFFAGTNRIGAGTFHPSLCPSPWCPSFDLTWSNVPPGNYTLTGRATDKTGLMTVSSPVHISVISTNPPERTVINVVATDSQATEAGVTDWPGGTNRPPVVQLNQPEEGAVFVAPGTIQLQAYANDPEDGFGLQPTNGSSALTVEFFAGTNKIGTGVFVPTFCPSPFCPFFAFTWSNVPPGEYTLRARATDSAGAATVSAPVHISVLWPGGTNLPVVSVRATIPDASEEPVFIIPLETGTGALITNPPIWNPVPANIGRFTFRRTGSLSNSLPVSFVLSGTASQWRDCTLGTNMVVFPPGASNTHLIVYPIDDSEAEPTETVELTIIRTRSAPETPFYLVGSPSNATVFIHDNDAPGVGTVSLISTGSVWKYLDDGTDQGAAWRAPAFDDSSWASGPAQLGYGDGDEATIVGFGPDPQNKFITTYFRHSFYITNAGSISNLVVRLLRDDGGIVYLNGMEVFRSNMPTGAVDASTLALIAAGGDDESINFFSAPIDLHLLAPGKNVLAVEIHQVNAASSDISFDLELGGTSGPPTPQRTIVSVVATAPQTSEPGILTLVALGQFAIRRTGNLGVSIPVSFLLGGSAANGVDYTFISNRVVIPAGATQTLVNVSPLMDNLSEGTETVVLTLVSPVCPAIFPPPPECYLVGSPSQATVSILDESGDGTNRPPSVTIVTPPNGSVFTQGMMIVLRASASDSDGTVARVEFRRGPLLIGLGALSIGSNYTHTLVWSNPPVGSHTVTAIAIDNLNGRSTSAPINITVHGPPTNNLLPVVTITRPTDGAVFIAPTSIPVEAETRDPNGYADTVEFFANNQKIGQAQVVFIQPPPPGQPIHFEFTWTNPPPGQYDLRATTVDNLGARGTSAPVNITVRSDEPPPPTNFTFQLAFNNRDGTEGVSFRQYTLDGAANGGRLLPAMRVVPDRFGQWYYGAEQHEVWRVNATNGQVQFLEIPPNLEELSWPVGAAFDRLRNRVLVATLGGEGFLYAYSPTGGWSIVNDLDNHDFDSVVHHSPNDSIYAFEGGYNGTPRLVRLSANGNYVSEITIPPQGFSITGHSSSSELVSVGEYLVLLIEPNPVWGGDQPPLESRIYLIDPRTGEVRLTYSRPLAPDSDHDGVPDATDQCPGTPLNTLVDEHGCSASQRDTDGDGVTDDRDQCPGMPADVAVNEHGCPIISPPPGALTFDDLSPGGNGSWIAIPNGYGGLQWNNFGVINGLLRPASEGYHRGVVSVSNVAFNLFGDPATISSSIPFDVKSAYLTAAINLPNWTIQVAVQGFVGTTLVYDRTFVLNNNSPTLVELNYAGVTRVRFVPSQHSTWFVMDNLSIGAVTNSDSDGDGVADVRDRCANTPSGQVVNENGCSIAQICPCAGPWRNHRQYVKCVEDTSEAFVDAGLSGEDEREEIIEEAQESNCGRRKPRLLMPPQCADEIRTNGCRLVLEGDGPATCVVEWSTDLVHWTRICTNALSGEPIEIRDPDAFGAPRRFYRLRVE
ncbi:MAG TPA: Ig-like domain-containing protein [Candidatus Limnocylindria bacterium]|nr:Ig-like domain-containing protein [Candidatus Limnocylindria bacterium]